MQNKFVYIFEMHVKNHLFVKNIECPINYIILEMFAILIIKLKENLFLLK